VRGKVRDHDLPIHFKWRRTLGGWKFLFLDGKELTPDSSKSAQWNRGAYLANGPSHCAECHSPAQSPGWHHPKPALRRRPRPRRWRRLGAQHHPAGIGDYSSADIERILESGDQPTAIPSAGR